MNFCTSVEQVLLVIMNKPYKLNKANCNVQILCTCDISLLQHEAIAQIQLLGEDIKLKAMNSNPGQKFTLERRFGNSKKTFRFYLDVDFETNSRVTLTEIKEIESAESFEMKIQLNCKKPEHTTTPWSTIFILSECDLGILKVKEDHDTLMTIGERIRKIAYQMEVGVTRTLEHTSKYSGRKYLFCIKRETRDTKTIAVVTSVKRI